MAQPSKQKVLAALLDRHGRTYAEEVGANVARGTPSPRFRLLCASLLFSARIRADIAVSAARALASWTTADKMAVSTWEDRTRTLNQAGYARYDERTARMLGETARDVVDRYGGDLRRLRDEAGRDPAAERRLLTRFKGIGDAGADIFLREVQGVWNEAYPFADRRALSAASDLGLGDDTDALRRLVGRDEFPRLVAALVRCTLARDAAEIREQAGGR